MRRHLLLLLPMLALSVNAIRIHTTQPPPAAPKPAAAPAAPPARPYQPTAALYGQQWNLTAVNAAGAWSVTRGSPVTVAVLDTGYAALPDLGSRVINGYDFVSDATRSGDGNGRDADSTDPGTTAYHASMVASLIGASHAGPRIAGLNPNARVLHVRVADANGEIRVEDLVDALRWSVGLAVKGAPANRTPARVVNLSLFADFIPLTGCDARVQAALDEVTARGVIVVAGAGNDARDASGYTPAGCRNVITVTAVDRTGRRAAYANWGAAITLAAPGGTVGNEVLSTTPVGAVRRTGTSLAAPHVAGTVSLMLGVRATLKFNDVQRMLQTTATPFPDGTCEPSAPEHSCGAGIVNAEAAVRAAGQATQR